MWLSLVGLICILTIAQAGHHKNHHRLPIIQLNGAEELIGSLREDEHVIAVSPHLSIYPDTGRFLFVQRAGFFPRIGVYRIRHLPK